tara:strand:- start:1900 stop:2763 length:864 start_codon:yes stop_codon:yes gene_type:complete
MLRILTQKYPAPSPVLRNLITATSFGLFIALFLLFFEPFDINLSNNENKVSQLLFFGCITTIVLVLFLYILPLLLPKVFSDKNWKVRHQMIFYLVILFVIATFNGIYTNYINSLPFSWYNYWWIISRTFVLGGIPIAFITVLDYNQKVKFNTNQASNILKRKKELLEDSKETTHTISTDLKNETFSLNEHDFHYAIAVGNYVDICYLHENILKKITYRITLSSFGTQLSETSYLIRCHRSYIVNLKKVENISGNAQGLKLELNNQTEIVPVSRKYIPIVKQFFIKNP